LRASLEAFGWKELFPAIEDQDGKVLVGHRRLKIAKELNIKPVVATVKCKDDNERWEIAVASNVGHAGMSKVDRQRIAHRMYTDGSNLTMEQIGAVLGVSKKTISLDLNEIVTQGNNQEHAKTARNPKGSGRPKGTKSSQSKKSEGSKKERKPRKAPPSVTPATDIAEDRLRSDPNVSARQLAKDHPEIGGEDSFERAMHVARDRLARPSIDASTLPMTAQEKLNAAIKQHQRGLDQKFEQRVREEIRRRMDDIILPEWKQRIEQAKKLFMHRRGAMDKATFNAIRRALHPDSRKSISDKVLGEAFDTFMSLEKYLLDEKDSPTTIGPVPDNLAEWDKMRAAADAERRAKRTNNGNSLRRR
jgi:ParB-like chromosome segregation protein Spo0J